MLGTMRVRACMSACARACVCACMCMRACERACKRACVRVRACVRNEYVRACECVCGAALDSVSKLPQMGMASASHSTGWN